jgi:hypothetical protein
MRILVAIVLSLAPMIASTAVAGTDTPQQSNQQCDLPPPLPSGTTSGDGSQPPPPTCSDSAPPTVGSVQKGTAPDAPAPAGAVIAFFTSLPGILTGIAAIVAAVGTVLVARKKQPTTLRRS